MHIVMFGTGGVGGYFGGRLAQAGEHITFVARGKHLEAIREHGLRVRSVQGDFTIHPAHVTDNPARLSSADIIIVTVKGWQVAEAAQEIRSMISPRTMVIPLLNGVEAPDQLASEIDPTRILGGLCWIVSFIAEPGVIQHTGVEPHITFGDLDGQLTERAEWLYKAFQRAGIKVTLSNNIRAAMWEKFIFIASISGIGAVTRVTVGEMRQHPETRQMIERAVKESIAVAHAWDIAISDDIFERTMGFIDNMPSHSTLSMQRDIMSGRPSELDSQNGAVVRLGREVGVDTPVHEFIYHSLLPMEHRARSPKPAEDDA
jgi:2-dehydropantoate 2-reductase